MDKNKKLFEAAKQVIPGGVNSPVRSFKSVGGTPVFIQKANGSKMWDENGKEYIDYCGSWGPMILGHAHPEVVTALKNAAEKGTSYGTATANEVTLAEFLVKHVPSIEQVRMTSSGTEAVMSAVRLARGFTGRNKILKFDGAYHGHADYLLVQGGSGLATLGQPDSLGVPKDFTKHTLVAPFNNLKQVEQAVKKYGSDLAAIIVEPVAGNCGVIPPTPVFLEGLRDLANRCGALLIFDEVITGFRLALGGAQEYFKVTPDLTCLGKIIGGGLPVGAYGGRKKIMEKVAPLGGVYQAGTLSGNPAAVACGLATLQILKKKNPYRELEARTKEFAYRIREAAAQHQIPVTVNAIGSMFTVFFTEDPVYDYASARTQDSNLFPRFYHQLLREGIYFSPSGFEANFLSLAHTPEDLEKTLRAIRNAFMAVRGPFLPLRLPRETPGESTLQSKIRR